MLAQVACGARHSAFVTREGGLWVCGHHGHGVLGLGQPAARLDAALMGGGGGGEAELYTGTGAMRGEPVQRVPVSAVPFNVQQVN